VPPILIDTPAAGATVTKTVRVAGTASVFEATLVVQLVQDGKVVEKQTVTASEGAPGRGAFETTLHGTIGRRAVQAFATVRGGWLAPAPGRRARDDFTGVSYNPGR